MRCKCVESFLDARVCFREFRKQFNTRAIQQVVITTPKPNPLNNENPVANCHHQPCVQSTQSSGPEWSGSYGVGVGTTVTHRVRRERKRAWIAV